MVKAKEPGMAKRVYFVQMLFAGSFRSAERCDWERSGDTTDSEMRAAFPSTVNSVVRYNVVPHTHCAPIHPCARISPSLKIAAVKM